MSEVIRTRNIPGINATFSANGVVKNFSVGGGSETVQSVGHNLSGLGSRDCGGPFLMTRTATIHSPGYYDSGSTNFRGTSWCNLPSGLFQAKPATSSDSALKVKGTQAIANTAPNNPAFSAPTAVGEFMQDGVPSLLGVETWRNRANLARGAGSEYLNYEFGWLPLISDVRTLAKTVHESHKILSEFKRGSGKLTRVGYSIPVPTDIVAGTYSGLVAANENGTTSASATGPGWSRTHRTGWFKGAFTYAVPTPHDTHSRFGYYAAEASKLLGVRMTPDTLWNLAPWSWAADWFTDTGSYITAISNLSQDGLVLVYGYEMEHTSSEAYWAPNKVTSTRPEFWRALPSTRRISEVKKRIPSKPFLGFTDGALTARQAAIAVALGLTHT